MKRLKRTVCLLLFSLLLSILAPNVVPGSISQVEAAVKISKKSVVLIKGQSATLKISGTKSKVKWSSNKTSVATVSQKGKITAKKKGTATITAKIGAKKYTCKVTVQTPSISKKSVALKKGSSTTLKLSGTNQKITWKSSNTSVATVSSKGKVTAKKKGSATITATVLKKKYTCKITVTESSSGISTKGTRLNPYSAKEYTKITINDYSDKKTIGLQLLETIDGEEANQIVYKENSYNEAPSSNERWVLYHFKLSYISGEKELEASDVIYKYYFYNHNANVSLQSVETATFSYDLEPYSIFNVRLYPGGSSDVWYGMLLNNSIPYTTFKVDCGYDDNYNQLETWFTTK